MRTWTVRDVREPVAHVMAWDEMNRLNHIQQKHEQSYQRVMRYDMNRRVA